MMHFHDSGTYMVKAELDLPEDVVLNIFDLESFIKLSEHFSDPDGVKFNCSDDFSTMKLKRGGTNVKYMTCESSFVQDQKNLGDLEQKYEYKITKAIIDELKKLRRLLNLDSVYFRFTGDGEVYIGCKNSEQINESGSESYCGTILKGEGENETFILSEFDFLPSDDYTIHYYDAGLIHFESDRRNIDFYVTLKDGDDE
jgi:hypothetical protein